MSWNVNCRPKWRQVGGGAYWSKQSLLWPVFWPCSSWWVKRVVTKATWEQTIPSTKPTATFLLLMKDFRWKHYQFTKLIYVGGCCAFNFCSCTERFYKYICSLWGLSPLDLSKGPLKISWNVAEFGCLLLKSLTSLGFKTKQWLFFGILELNYHMEL